METKTLIEREKASHWYAKDGTPVHSVPYKDKKRAGEMQPTKVNHARELGLLPSVTNVIQVLSKPALTAWITEQAILAALTLPRGRDEGDDEFARRVVLDMDKQRDKAADFGTAAHAVAEGLHKTGVLSGPVEVLPYLQDYRRWFKENIVKVHYAEEVMVNLKYGYAGTVDLIATHKVHGKIAIDLKTQGVKERPVFYPEWGLQLAAYHEGRKDLKGVMSVIIDSTKPSIVNDKLWDDHAKDFKAFLHCLGLWQWQKNYVPVTK